MNLRLLPVLLCLVCTSRAMFMRPEWVPVDRLVGNTARYVAARPSEASAHYALGRLHYLAFTLKMDLVPAFPHRDDELAKPVPDHLVGLPLAGAREQRAMELARAEVGVKADDPDERQRFFQTVSRYRTKLEVENWTPPRATPEVLLDHAAKAVASLRKAMELDSKEPLFPLGLGSLFVQFADWNDEAHVRELPETLRGDLRRDARAHFLAAWKRAYPNDSKTRTLPIGGLSQFVSFEAGHAFLRLAESAPDSLSTAEKTEVRRIKAGLAGLEKLPMGAITPLVLSLRPKHQIAELLAPDAAVEFDMTGLGRRDRWSWVSPDLGILVWDPLDRREITSGRQLFGNFSFQGIWRNGFEALRALDDNGDGQIAGAELKGLALWFDRDGDGRSLRTEVSPVEQLGLAALSCEPMGTDGPHLMNRSGAMFNGGRTLPVWDWIVEPARLKPAD